LRARTLLARRESLQRTEPERSVVSRTYYPGTIERAAAMPVIVEQGRAREAFDFSIPFVLPKGELEYTVETQHQER